MCTNNLSIIKPVARQARASQCGISLIELIMFIVIVGASLSGILLVMNTTAKNSADPLVGKQALAIAESLLEEVELMPFTYCDPDDANAPYATAATAAQCPKAGGLGGVEAMGAEAGEARGSATFPFDNVNDYSGFSMAAGSIMNITGVNTGVQGYSASITMSNPAFTANGVTIAGTDANAAPQVILINVTVTHTTGYTVTLEGYRLRYSPRAVP